MSYASKKFRAAVCLLLSLILSLTMVSFPASVSALGLSKTSISLTKGYSTTISVTGSDGSSVKWSSSDTSIATVSSKGKVVGKKIGNAVITANVGGTKLECKVKVVGGKLAFSKKDITLDEGDITYITVRAKGSHKLKATPVDRGIVSVTWVKPWKKDDIRLKITAKSAGTTTVRVKLTNYPDIYTDIKVKVNGDDSGVIYTKQDTVTTTVGGSSALSVYTDMANSLDYSFSEAGIAKVEEGKWVNFYCYLTITGLKEGTTTLTISRKDNPSIKKNVTIKVTEAGYYVVSDTPVSKSTFTDIVYRWVDSKTNKYKYMLLPVNYDEAKMNYAICEDAGLFEYYMVFSASPKKQKDTDSIMTINATINNTSEKRYVLVPKDYDKPTYNTAVASYTKEFKYYEIYNINPESYKNRASDSVKSWTAVVDFKTVTRYMLVPYGYDEDYVNSLIEADSGNYDGYYTVYTQKPNVKEPTDQILTFTAALNYQYVTYYVLVPKNYDVGRYNDIVAKYRGYYEYWTIYNTKPVTTSSDDIIESWTKIIDSKTVTRYILLPPHYSKKMLDEIKEKDLATQTSAYYSVTTSYPTKLDKTDIIQSWYNTTQKVTKYILLPKDYNPVKRNDIIAADTGIYDYYKMYSKSPAKKTGSDIILEITHMTYGKIFMLVPEDYEQSKVNLGMAGVDVTV